MSDDKEFFTISTSILSSKKRAEEDKFADFMPTSKLSSGGFKIKIGVYVPSYVVKVLLEVIPDVSLFGEDYLHMKNGINLATVIQSMQFQLRQQGIIVKMLH